jgi:hypothetical protein
LTAVLEITTEVLEQAFEHLRACGQGRRECVVYLTGAVDEPGRIDGVVHPAHTASAAGYEVGTKALGELSAELLVQRRSVRAQMHTTPARPTTRASTTAARCSGPPGFSRS